MNDATAAEPSRADEPASGGGLVMVDGDADADAGACADGVCAVPPTATPGDPSAGA
ncbi:hypothetical protein CLV30_102360 [Haloactinopolyspora alba]|uniref:Uncharacterized protein n=1 Tax=Haloactinopolyspora alba TaxID=648780 RepID=A0A2P8EBX9_9ACTN|nr:hypothetical protein [Haloactinopolyspora alba]PSL06971.1 hypothetical protein CLV30_102360 [Haloactinopolyspora alba]